MDTRQRRSSANLQSRTPKSKGNSHVSEAANELLNESKKMANELYQESINKVHEVQNHIKGYSDELATKIQKNPLKSMLIAGGVGFLLSVILRR